MKFKIFAYNSIHKVITAALFIIWAIYHFSGNVNRGNDYYSNGQIKRTGQIKGDKNEGTWTWYYANGNKRMQGNFKNGKREGTWVIWDKNGNKKSIRNYKNNMLNGYCIELAEDGTELSRKFYNNDKQVIGK